jgi:hypothetical protein
MLKPQNNQTKFYTFSQYKAAVRQGRHIKRVAHDESIRLGGTPGSALSGILTVVDAILQSMNIHHEDWVNRKLEQLSSEFSLDITAIEDSYRTGLRNTFIQDYRTAKKLNLVENHKFSNPGYIQDVIAAYTFDFYRIVITSCRLGIELIRAVQIAKHAHHHDPDTLITFKKTYTGLPLYAITYAMINNPAHPETVLERVTTALEELSMKFPDIPRDAILTIALYRNGPYEDQLNRIQNMTKKLAPLFPNLPAYVITLAVVSYAARPKEFLEDVEAKISSLTPVFPSLPSHVITHAAINYPSNSMQFLETVQEKKEYLKSLFFDTPPSIILYAIVHFSDDPSSFLRTYESNIKRLSVLYKGLSKRHIIHASVYYPGNPEKYLDQIREEKFSYE